MNIQVNGSLDLADTLKTIYEATKKERSWAKWKKTTKELLSARPLLNKFVNSKFFPIIIIVFILMITVPILNIIGITHVTFTQFVTSVYIAIKHYIPNF
mgnify:FL=1